MFNKLLLPLDTLVKWLISRSVYYELNDLHRWEKGLWGDIVNECCFFIQRLLIIHIRFVPQD